MGSKTDQGTIGLKRSFFPTWTRLDAYIYNEIHFPFAMAMLVYNGVFFIRTFGEVSELSGGRFDIPLDLLLVIFLSEIPDMLLMTTSLSFLSAALIAVGRLSADSEIIAPQAIGVSFWRMSKPVLSYAFILSMLLFFLLNWGAPRVKRLAGSKTRIYFDTEALPNIQPSVITPLSGNSVLYVDRMDPLDPSRMEDLVMINRNKKYEELVLADKASVYTNRSLELFRGTNLRLSNEESGGIEIIGWERWEQPFPIPAEFARETLKIKNYELFSTPQLYKYLQVVKKPNYEWNYILYYRLLTPFVCFALAMFAVPLAARHSRVRKGSGLGMSLLLVGVYFALSKTGKSAVEDGRVHALIGVGSPLLIYLVIGLLMMLGKNLWWGRYLETSGHLRGGISRLFKAAMQLFRRGRRRKSMVLGGPASTLVFPSKLDIYTSKLFFSIYLLVQSSFITLYLLVEYIQLGDHIRKNQPGADVVFGYFLYKIPEVIDTTMFICLLTAVLILLTVMSRNNEVTAVRASGGSMHRLCLPLVLYGMLFSAGTYYLGNTLLPQMNRMAATYKNNIRNRTNTNIFRTRDVWLRTRSGEIVNYKHFSDKDNRLIGVSRYRLDEESGQPMQIVREQNLRFEGESWLVESTGAAWLLEKSEEGDLVPKPFQIENGSVCELQLDMSDLSQRRLKAAEFSIAGLKEHLDYLQSLGYDEDQYRTALYVKYAQPLVPMIMILLAMPLGFQSGRRGALYGLAAGFIAGMSFLGLMELFKKLGASGVLNPVTAGWSVVVMLGSIALYRYINME